MTTIKNNYRGFNLLCLISIVLFVILSTSITYAQETAAEPNKPVSGVFNSGVFLENQTTVMYPKKTIEFVINHRFGTMGNGLTDVYGLFAPSNIRLGLNYAICDKFQIGLGLTKYNKQEDLNYKLSLVEQTTNNKIPVSIVYFGSVYLDARETATSFNYSNYKYSQSFSYYNEVMISRKFTDFLSLQVAATYAHINISESFPSAVYPENAERLRRWDNFGITALGKVNFTPTLALMLEYDKNFSKLYQTNDKYQDPKPNYAIGIENSTAAHSFQIFVSTASAITYQTNMVYNQNTFSSKGLMLGFNITRVFY